MGALDEAAKSRVHISLFYPYLGENETLSLFGMNISRLQRIEKERTEIMAIDRAKVMIIEEATVEFEVYRQEMYGKLEIEIVAERGERVK